MSIENPADGGGSRLADLRVTRQSSDHRKWPRRIRIGARVGHRASNHLGCRRWAPGIRRQRSRPGADDAATRTLPAVPSPITRSGSTSSICTNRNPPDRAVIRSPSVGATVPSASTVVNTSTEVEEASRAPGGLTSRFSPLTQAAVRPSVRKASNGHPRATRSPSRSNSPW